MTKTSDARQTATEAVMAIGAYVIAGRPTKDAMTTLLEAQAVLGRAMDAETKDPCLRCGMGYTDALLEHAAGLHDGDA